ncbi:prepilin peptidase [Streptomyces sp. NPDC050504]|uniref:prepilin peptidase n=1 Tax=Streptomyces sp. NPDC050504 TaxID=3365618 RepID=UPI00378CB959
MYVMLIAVATVWGAATGLLVPRAAYRFSVEPEERWRGTCPGGHPFTGPAGGWLGRARCGACGVPGAGGAAAGGSPGSAVGPAPAKGPVYGRPAVLVPAVSALSCALLAAATGFRPELAVWLPLVPFAVLLSVVDRRVHRLPDHLTLPLAVVVPLLLGGAALLPGAGGAWTTALLGGLALGGAYFVLFLINPNGLGFGDVKLAVPLGVALGWYGWDVLFAGAFAGFLFGTVYGLGLMVSRRGGRKTAIPFGPFMIAGGMAGMLLGAVTS